MVKAKKEPNNILQAAEAVVYGDREAQYGSPVPNFEDIATLWTTYLNNITKYRNHVNPMDVAALNVLQKVARLARNQTHMDTITDIAGFAAVMERLNKEK